MRAFDDGASIYDVRAAKQHLRDGHQERGLVNRRQQFIEIDANGIRAAYRFDACAMTALLMVKILHRREFLLHHHNFVSRTLEIKAGPDDCLRNGDVLVQR
jgi:hypothetical protein